MSMSMREWMRMSVEPPSADAGSFERALYRSLFDDSYGHEGIPPHDVAVDYPQHAVIVDGGKFYRALVATGPETGNILAPSADTRGRTWAQVTEK